MKHLIIIDDSKMPFESLRKAIVPYQKSAQASKAKGLSFEANGLIALIHLDMPASEQFALLVKIKSAWPRLKVIFAGSMPSVSEVILLFREGLVDYLTSPVDAQDIVTAFQRLQHRQEDMQFNPLSFGLTEREFEVCNLLVSGLKSRDIAEHLKVTPATIKVHKSRIMDKLQVSNLPDLVRMVAT